MKVKLVALSTHRKSKTKLAGIHLIGQLGRDGQTAASWRPAAGQITALYVEDSGNPLGKLGVVQAC